MPKKYLPNYIFIVSALSSIPVWAGDDVAYAEFDGIFLNNQQIDTAISVDNFRYGNPVYPGKYLADVYLNGRLLSRETIVFKGNAVSKDQAANLCINSKLVKRLNLNYGTLPDNNKFSTLTEDDCQNYQSLFPEGVNFNFVMSSQRLDITIPQLYLYKTPSDYIDQEFWDEGVNSAFIAYNMNYYNRKYHDENYQNGYLRLNTGINFGSWHFRHSGAVHHDKENGNRYQYYQTYLQHDIPSWRSQLKIGDTYTQGNLLAGTMMRGVQLNTDARMLPPSQRGYAPQITGQANSNAMVQIFQSDQEIYNTTVPPGPFVIDDLHSIGQYGELLVRITEADGSIREFTVPYSSMSRLLRPGTSNYELTLGQLVNNNQSLDEAGAQFTWEHGFSNNFTGNLGLIVGQHYRSLLLGTVWSTGIGTVGLDATVANSILKNAANQTGMRYHLSYNYRIPFTQTNLLANAAFYSKESFYSWREVAVMNNDSDRFYNYDLHQSIKSEYQLALSQPLFESWGNLSFSLNYRNYWQEDYNQNSWSLTYSNHIGIVQYNLYLNQTHYRHSNDKDKQIGLSISIPFSSKAFVSAYAQRNDDRTTINTNLSGVLDEKGNYSYGLNYNYNNNSDNSWYVNAAARTRAMRLTASYGHLGSESSQWSLGAEGAVVLHSGGLLTSSYLGDTFAIIRAKDAEGAKVLYGQDIYLNRDGYAILPSLMPYTNNVINLDPSGLPVNVTLKTTQQKVVPRANSSVLIDIPTTSGKTVLLQLTMANGEFVPLGAVLFNARGENQGVVSSAGRVLVNPEQEKGYFEARWGNRSCVVAYDLHQVTQVLNSGIQLLRGLCITQ